MAQTTDQGKEKPNYKGKKKPYYKKRPYQAPRKKRFWNSDKIVSLSAMAIALFTLVVLIYQSNILGRQYDLTVKQQKASVLPYLAMGPSNKGDQYSVFLQNKGLGPAFIKGFYFQQKDTVYFLDNMLELYMGLTDNASDSLIDGIYASVYNGMVIAPGESLEIIAITGPPKGVTPAANFLSSYFGGDSLKFIIEYESVFEDGWVLGSDFTNVTKEEFGDFKSYYYK